MSYARVVLGIVDFLLAGPTLLTSMSSLTQSAKMVELTNREVWGSERGAE